MPAGGRIVRNVMWLLVSDVAVRAIGALTTIVIVRHLGTLNYGSLAVALAFSAIATYCTDLGLTHTFIREGSRPEADIPSLLATALKIRLLLSLAVSCVAYVLIPQLYQDVSIRTLVWWATFPAIWGVNLQGLGCAYFQLTEQMHLMAVVRSVNMLSTSVAVLAGIALHASLQTIALIYGFSPFVASLVSLWLLLHQTPIRGSWQWALLGEFGYFTAVGLLTTWLPQIGPLTMQRVTDLAQVGSYAAADKIPSLLYVLPGTVAAAFYPVLFRLGAVDRPAHVKVTATQLRVMVAIGFCLAAPLSVYADFTLRLLYGRGWADPATIRTLSLLAWVLVGQCFVYPLADALTTTGLQRRRMRALLAASVIGGVAFYVLSKTYGAIGGGVASIVVQFVLIVGLVMASRYRSNLFRACLPQVLGGLLLLASSLVMRYLGVNEWIGATLPSLVYALCMARPVTQAMRSVAHAG